MHRIEGYQIRILDKPTGSGFPWLADLGTVHNFRYKQREYGQFGAQCTFSLESGDPNAATLNDSSIHFLWVLREGETVFSGFQASCDLGEDEKTGEPLYDFEFLPLAHWLHYRSGLPLAGGAELEVNTTIDDAFKWIIERVLGSTAPASPTNAIARAWACLSVAANKTEHPNSAELNATYHGDIYEWLQRRAVGYEIDWDIYFKLDGANIVPEFETWYPRRGADRTETNTDGNRAIIFSDAMGQIRQQSYGQRTAAMGTVFYTRDLATEIVADSGEITNWLARDVLVPTDDTTEVLQIARAENGRKLSYKLREFRETLGMQWVTHFSVGDEVTLNSIRMNRGPWDDVICGMDVEIDEQGFEHLDPLFGDPKPDIMDQLRGGGEGVGDPDYTKAVADDWHLWGDTPTNVLPDGTGGIGIEGGVGITVTEDAATHKLTIDAGSDVWHLYSDPSPIDPQDVYPDDDNGIGILCNSGLDIEFNEETHFLKFNSVWLRNAGSPSYLHPETHGDELHIYSDADALVFRVAGDGSTTWAAGATLTLESLLYTPPTSLSEYGFLQLSAVAGSAGTLAWTQIIASGTDDPGANIPIWYDTDEDPSDGYWTRAGTVLRPTADGDDLHLRSGGDFKMFSDAGTTTTIEVDGATGNVIIKGTLDVYGKMIIHGADFEVHDS